MLITISRGDKPISSINFIGNKKVRTKRLKEVIASEENKFWKVLSKNTALSLIDKFRSGLLVGIINL